MRWMLCLPTCVPPLQLPRKDAPRPQPALRAAQPALCCRCAAGLLQFGYLEDTGALSDDDDDEASTSDEDVAALFLEDEDEEASEEEGSEVRGWMDELATGGRWLWLCGAALRRTVCWAQMVRMRMPLQEGEHGEAFVRAVAVPKQ